MCSGGVEDQWRQIVHVVNHETDRQTHRQTDPTKRPTHALDSPGEKEVYENPRQLSDVVCSGGFEDQWRQIVHVVNHQVVNRWQHSTASQYCSSDSGSGSSGCLW